MKGRCTSNEYHWSLLALMIVSYCVTANFCNKLWNETMNVREYDTPEIYRWRHFLLFGYWRSVSKQLKTDVASFQQCWHPGYCSVIDRNCFWMTKKSQLNSVTLSKKDMLVSVVIVGFNTITGHMTGMSQRKKNRLTLLNTSITGCTFFVYKRKWKPSPIRTLPRISRC